MPPATIAAARAALTAGRTTAAALLDAALARIHDPAGEGARAFTLVLRDSARAEAARADALLASGGGADLPLLGIPVSVKDLFDIAGQVTTAGSTVLRDEPPAAADAAAVARLRAAGAVIVGRTNMTEFAFSGLGLNPHYGTPRNPFDRATGRIPGGSSSGAAVSVSDGMCLGAVGTDTGGSVRIPAALCGLAGFKPTQAAVPLAGAYPLSQVLDSIGPIARTVADCRILHAVLSGAAVPAPALPARLRLAVPQNWLLDGLDAQVAADFQAALARIAALGHIVEPVAVPAFDRLAEAARIGAFPGIEAWAMQKDRLARQGDAFDPRVRRRIEAAAGLAPDAFARLTALRSEIRAAAEATLAPHDALLAPTVPLVAPAIAALEDEAAYGRVNLAMLRNPTAINFIDGCAASIPMQAAGAAPTGLMVGGPNGADARILAIAELLETGLHGG